MHIQAIRGVAGSNEQSTVDADSQQRVSHHFAHQAESHALVGLVSGLTARIAPAVAGIRATGLCPALAGRARHATAWIRGTLQAQHVLELPYLASERRHLPGHRRQGCKRGTPRYHAAMRAVRDHSQQEAARNVRGARASQG